MKRLCVFWRENKGASVVEMRFGPCYFLQAQFFPAVQMYLRGTMEDGIFSKWKKVNNLSIDHFPSACSQSAVHRCFTPILSHYILFSHCAACLAERKVASRSDHDTLPIAAS